MNQDIIYIPYGSDKLPLFCPQNRTLLQVQEPEKNVSPSLFQEQLKNYLQIQPLDLHKTCIVVADKTRLCGYPEYLPLLIDTLAEAGMDTNALKIIIAYGTHPPQTKEECIEAYGEIYEQYNFIHHDCTQTGDFVDMGSTRRGTPIRFRKDLVSASAVITMGAVCHHYFAGYGGGRKLIFPGCGEREAIYTNHGLYLNKQSRMLSPGCQPGNFDDNPLAEDLFEVEEKLPAHLAIHGIIDSHGTLSELLVGNSKDTFKAACRRHGKNCEVQSSAFDCLIASCGGFPKDINFIQAHKAIHNAAMFVKDGGLLLLYTECRDAIGSKTFLPWFEKESFESAFEELSEHYEGNGGTALAMMTKLQRIRIGLVTSIDEALCKKIGVEKWQHNQVNDHLTSLDRSQSLGIIPNASLLVKVTEKNRP